MVNQGVPAAMIADQIRTSLTVTPLDFTERMPLTAASRVSFSRDFNEREGDGIDAVALIRRSRTIVEHMTEVGLTPSAKNFYSSDE